MNSLGLMTLVTCLVRIGGDLNNVIQPASRGFGPGIVSWPEVLVLREIHGGEEAVEAIRWAGTAQSTPAAEKARLLRIYGAAVPESLFPGSDPRIPLEMPEDAMAVPEIDTGDGSLGNVMLVPAFTLGGDAARAMARRGAQVEAGGLGADEPMTAVGDTGNPGASLPEGALRPGLSLGSLLDTGGEAASVETTGEEESDPAIRTPPPNSNRNVRIKA